MMFRGRRGCRVPLVGRVLLRREFLEKERERRAGAGVHPQRKGDERGDCSRDAEATREKSLIGVTIDCCFGEGGVGLTVLLFSFDSRACRVKTQWLITTGAT